MSQEINLDYKERVVFKDEICILIRKTTKGKEITAQTIADFITTKYDLKPKFSPSKVRACINLLRQEGMAICANGNGYFWGNIEDINSTITSLKSRVSSINAAIGGLVQCLQNIIIELEGPDQNY